MLIIRNLIIAIMILLSFGLALDCKENETAPFNGTIFIDKDIITPDDPTTFVKLYYNGKGLRTMYDRRVEDWLDSYHSKDPDWKNAQLEDCNFISTYAQNNPEREDIAESYLPYFAIRYRPERISKSLKEKIEKTIPNRIRYFDNKNFNMYPMEQKNEKE